MRPPAEAATCVRPGECCVSVNSIQVLDSLLSDVGSQRSPLWRSCGRFCGVCSKDGVHLSSLKRVSTAEPPYVAQNVRDKVPLSLPLNKTCFSI